MNNLLSQKKTSKFSTFLENIQLLQGRNQGCSCSCLQAVPIEISLVNTIVLTRTFSATNKLLPRKFSSKQVVAENFLGKKKFLPRKFSTRKCYN